MSKSLKDINTSLEKQINEYLKKSEEEITKIKKSTNDKFAALNDVAADTDLDFLEIAEASREMTDLDCGIITTKISKEESGISIVGGEENADITIRDGRFKEYFVDGNSNSTVKSHPSESKYTWIGQMAITAQGVSKLVEFNNNDDKESKKKGISNFLKASLIEIDGAEGPEDYKKIVLNFNKTLHNYVKKQNLQFENEGNIEILNSDKKVTKAIDTARHFAQLDLEHTHNITISNNDNKDIIQTNLIVNSNHKKNDFKDTNWHTELNPVSKSFFEKFKEQIKSGAKVISSRLKNLVGLPANTNAYMSFNHTYDNTNQEKPLTQIGTPNFRTAALANTKGSDAYENTKAAVENMVDINKAVNHESKGLVVLNLNNTVFFDRKESKIRKNTERACREINSKGGGVEYKNVPINGSSTWSYLFGENKQKKFEKIIDIILEAERDGKTLLIQCKSGKDRTGYTQALKNSVDYFSNQKENILYSKEKKEILKGIIDDNVFQDYTKDHVQEYQAGGVGGSLGINALKSGGFTLTGGTQFLHKIGAEGILKTNGLDKLNKFKAGKDTENGLEETRGQNVDNENTNTNAELNAKETEVVQNNNKKRGNENKTTFEELYPTAQKNNTATTYPEANIPAITSVKSGALSAGVSPNQANTTNRSSKQLQQQNSGRSNS